MKLVNLQFIPETEVDVKGSKQKSPHQIDYTASHFIAKILYERINKENPELEYRVANDLYTTGKTNLNNQDAEYIKAVIVSLSIDNELKGQILERF